MELACFYYLLQHARMKTILITGGSSGIGAALARYYAARGQCRLILMGRNQSALDALSASLGRDDVHVVTAGIDITDAVAIRTFVLSMDDQYRLDLVIANAGVSGGTSGFGWPTDMQQVVEQADKIFAVNMQGVLNVMHAVLPRMVARNSGQIALMSSLAGFMPLAGAPAYSASKAFVRFYGESLCAALSKTNVRMSVICPGFIKTPMTKSNPFPMPFLMDVDQAAVKIARGIDAGKARIAFPWPMFLSCWFVGLLPAWFVTGLSSRLPAKPSL